MSSTMAEQPRHGAISAGLVALLLLAGGSPASAAGSAPSLAAQLGGKTLSAVAYVPRASGAGGGSLQRIVLQAYLAADGKTLLRQWIGARNSYSRPVQTRWSLSEDTLCINLPTAPLCAKVHIWGPRIAGIGTQPYAMLDGDLQPGNAITGTR
jgi:hypothetical protein